MFQAELEDLFLGFAGFFRGLVQETLDLFRYRKRMKFGSWRGSIHAPNVTISVTQTREKMKKSRHKVLRDKKL
jgi:hypothetical protein